MSDSPEERAMATVQKAKQMIADVKRQMEDGEDTLRKLGVDPEKARAFCDKSLGAEDRNKAEEQFKQDMAAIEDEVQQARMHSEPQDSAGKAKRPRSMV